MIKIQGNTRGYETQKHTVQKPAKAASFKKIVERIWD